MEVNKIIQGDCIEVMRGFYDNSIDTIITDPPYGLEFMGKDWDAPWKGQASKEFNTIPKGSLGGFKKLPNHSRVNNLKCLNCNKWKFSSNEAYHRENLCRSSYEERVRNHMVG